MAAAVRPIGQLRFRAEKRAGNLVQNDQILEIRLAQASLPQESLPIEKKLQGWLIQRPRTHWRSRRQSTLPTRC